MTKRVIIVPTAASQYLAQCWHIMNGVLWGLCWWHSYCCIVYHYMGRYVDGNTGLEDLISFSGTFHPVTIRTFKALIGINYLKLHMPVCGTMCFTLLGPCGHEGYRRSNFISGAKIFFRSFQFKKASCQRWLLANHCLAASNFPKQTRWFAYCSKNVVGELWGKH